jgi:hypothetical protein
MVKQLLALGLVVVTWGLSGCALTVHDTRVDYKYTKDPCRGLQ